MMASYEYHQLLKFIYFEGYADSYEDAEYLLEEFDDDEYEELCEKFVKAMDTRRIGGYRHLVRKVDEEFKDLTPEDALIRTSVGRSANLQKRINDLKNQ